MDRLLIVANELPVYADTTGDKIEIHPSDELKYSGMESFYKQYETRWIGCLPESNKDADNKPGLDELLAENQCIRVKIDDETIKDALQGFAGGTLWPLFHYVPSATVYEDRYWEAYTKFNETYAEVLRQVIRKGDRIWIHDYHLLLLPKMIRDTHPRVSIGLFVHIPFPSFEVFRLLPWREEVLEGMLGADLVGFQIFDYVRHMLSAVRRLLGVDTTFNRIMIGDRTMKVDVFPRGIDVDRFTREVKQIRKAMESRDQDSQIMQIRKQFPKEEGRKYILTIDPLDYTKGIPQRIRAYEQFLEQWPEYRERVTMLLITLPFEWSEDRNEKIFHEVNELVGRLNGQYGTLNWTPVVYVNRSLTPEELVALYAHADIALIAPFRDGMNMTAKEFVAASENDGGVLILSELAGASKEFHEAVIVNPNNLNEMVRAIHEAIKMDLDEQQRRMQVMNRRLKKYPVTRWAKEFIDALDQVIQIQEVTRTRRVTETRIREFVKAYQNAKRRILFLDYDGTLAHFTKNPQDARPDDHLYDILKNLTAQENTRVVIISGRDRETLGEWFPEGWRLHLVAEHGVWLKDPGYDWYMMEVMDKDWKQEIYPLLDYYVDQTPKAFIEEKNFSLAWHYRKSDPDLGIQRAWELKEQLRNLTANLNLEIMDGDKVLEIKYSGINKGKAAQLKLAEHNFDFIFAIGDDWTDEYTFEAMPESAITVKVGTKTTKAKYYLETVDEVRALLASFN